MCNRLVGLVLVSLVSSAACGPTSSEEGGPETIDADIREPRVLVNRIENSDSADYLVTKPIAVWADVTVEPGVRIEFSDDASIWIGNATGEGSFKAIGTEAEPIILTAENPGDAPTWPGIGFGSSSADNQLEFVTVEHAGSAPSSGLLDIKAGVTLWDGMLSIVDSTIQDCLDYGFAAVTSPGAVPTIARFERNTLIRNGTPVRLTTNLIGAMDSASAFTGNDADIVDVAAVDFDPTVTEATSIAKIDVPYRLSGEVAFFADVTVEAGTTFTMAADSAIIVGNATGDGSLALQGTMESPIVIDGEVAGAGSWGGIVTNSGSDLNVFDYVDIGGGGNLTPITGDPANVVVGGGGITSRLALSHSTIHDSAGAGVFVKDPSVLTGSDNTYRDNAGGDVSTDAM